MRHTIIDRLAALDLPSATAAQLRLPSGPLALRRAWPRSDDHLLLEYEATDGSIVPGQWHRLGEQAARATAGLPAEMTALIDVGKEDGTGIVALQRGGADRRLHGLASLVDRAEALLLVHQPERRAVVRFQMPSGTLFAKVMRSGRTGAHIAAGQAATALGYGAFDTPQLIAYNDTLGVVFWTALDGVALHDLADAAQLERGAYAVGAALRALHESPTPPNTPAHGPDAEIALLEKWVARTAAFAPALGARLAAAIPAVRSALSAERGPYTVIHRDFYDKQVLIGKGGRVGMLDFDTLAWGEPALDLANALVHFELRALQGIISAEAAKRAAAALLAGYRPDPAVRARLGAYAAATRLRLACVYSFRPRWRYYWTMDDGRRVSFFLGSMEYNLVDLELK